LSSGVAPGNFLVIERVLQKPSKQPKNLNISLVEVKTANAEGTRERIKVAGAKVKVPVFS
jgi:hypothetical protein